MASGTKKKRTDGTKLKQWEHSKLEKNYASNYVSISWLSNKIGRQWVKIRKYPQLKKTNYMIFEDIYCILYKKNLVWL